MSAFKTWLTGLTSKTTPVDADETYLRDSEDSGASKKLTWVNVKATLKTYFDTLYLALTGGTVAGGTRTTSGSTLTITETLNNAGVTFPGALVVDVTDTASDAASLLANFKVGGVSKFSITKAGMLTVANNIALGNTTITPAGVTSIVDLTVVSNGGNVGFTSNSGGNFGWAFRSGTLNLQAASDAALGWTGAAASTNQSGPNGTVDVALQRDAAGILAQRNGTNAQASRLYGTYTDASNYRRVALAMTTAGVATLAPEGAGTGASGNVLHISGLPTSNPGPGILWNDTGTVKVGT